MSKKVLVIDDEPEMLNLIQYTLEKAGFAVSVCNSGRDAFKRIEDEKPDLVILDVMLPGIDGYSLQLKISQADNTKKIPIVVLTALEPSKTLFQKFPQVAGFMTKPFRTDDLIAKVQSILNAPAN
jgi:two-component system alkaline phosphatase synthesis response regulator PhoP